MTHFFRVCCLGFLALTMLSQSDVAAQEAETRIFEEADCLFQIAGIPGRDVTCGYLFVPEDRTNPDSPSIRLAVAIFHHPDDNPEPDPLVYLMGGPGVSVVSTLPWTFSAQFEPLFAANRDIIIFDQRGSGLSDPALTCPVYDDLFLRALGTDAVSHADYLEALQICYNDLNDVANLSAYNSAASAADLDDLRIALGYEQFNLWGISYGTRLALTAMRDYPDGIRSVVLDSVYPLEVSLYTDGPDNASRAFDLLFDACAADSECNTAYPDLRTVFYGTVDRLNAQPYQTSISHPVTAQSYDITLNGDLFIGVIFRLLYRTDVLPQLPRIIYAFSQGQYQYLAGLRSALFVEKNTGTLLSVACNEELPFSDYAALETALAAHPDLRQLYDDSLTGRLIYDACAFWDSGEADPVEAEPVISDIPTLIMTGEFDPVTPPAWAERAKVDLAQSFYFEYPATGHGASVSHACPRAMMIAFLSDPAQMPDATCIRDMHIDFE